MGTSIRPEVSEQNKYWIEKHRYYELKHFCLQYPIWKKSYRLLDGFARDGIPTEFKDKAHRMSNPTATCAEARLFYSERIDMVKNTAIKTDPSMSFYILKGVTEGLSYDCLKARYGVPCCKDTYYDLYRKFFWILHNERK